MASKKQKKTKKDAQSVVIETDAKQFSFMTVIVTVLSFVMKTFISALVTLLYLVVALRFVAMLSLNVASDVLSHSKTEKIILDHANLFNMNFVFSVSSGVIAGVIILAPFVFYGVYKLFNKLPYWLTNVFNYFAKLKESRKQKGTKNG